MAYVKVERFCTNPGRPSDGIHGPSALDNALSDFDESVLADILESWFILIRNRPVVTGSDEKRWQTGITFVTSIVTWLSKSVLPDDQLRRIEHRLHRLSTLYDQLHVRRNRPMENIRSLPASAVEALYAVLDPNSDINPFAQDRTRWRVFVAFVLMLHQGLRRGEILLLPADAVKSAYDSKQCRTRYWLNVQQNPYESAAQDARYSKPSIKTSYSIRQLPVSEVTAKIIQSYVDNYRGRPNHSFLFNSQTNLPMATETLTKIFAAISSHLPRCVVEELFDRTGKKTITPHDLRHTSVVVRLQQLLEQGDSMEEALQKLRTFFGWAKTSLMPSRYARSVFEDRLATVWNNAFDERVEILRALPKRI
jgi:integrase